MTTTNRAFVEHQRASACAYWREFCIKNFKWGDKITVRSDTLRNIVDREFNEDVIYQYADLSHINAETENGVKVGLPMCYVIDIWRQREA